MRGNPIINGQFEAGQVRRGWPALSVGLAQAFAGYPTLSASTELGGPSFAFSAKGGHSMLSPCQNVKRWRSFYGFDVNPCPASFHDSGRLVDKYRLRKTSSLATSKTVYAFVVNSDACSTSVAGMLRTTIVSNLPAALGPSDEEFAAGPREA